MQYWMLLLRSPDDGTDAAEPLGSAHRFRLQTGLAPRGQKVHVAVYPERIDTLRESAQCGGEQAYAMLWREQHVDEQLSIDFHTKEIPHNIVGRSADLAFALAVTLQVYAATSGSEPFYEVAATGTLDANNRVLWVEGCAAKLRAAVGRLSPSSAVFFPRACRDELVDSTLFADAAERGIRLFEVATLEEAALRAGLPIDQVPVELPFLGLSAFDEAQHRIFFGRKKEVQVVRERLIERDAAGSPGLLVIGASGVGKSSFIKAGVVPSLLHGPAALRDRTLDWFVWMPRQAVERDEHSLADSLRLSWSSLPDLRGLAENNGSASLAELAALIGGSMRNDRRLVWVLDQMEELFTLGFEAAAVTAFGAFVLDLQRQGVWVVATMRPEFYARYQSEPSLVVVFPESGVYNLRAVAAESRRGVITGPAEKARLTFEVVHGDSLVDRLLADMAKAPDSLPLLAFALSQLHARRDTDKNCMTFAAYEQIGGLEGSIANAAAEAYARLGDAAKKELPRLLRLLVQPTMTGGPDIAHPVALDRWDERSPIRSLVRALEATRLMTVEPDVHGVPMARLTHEAVLTHWRLAVDIITDSRDIRASLSRWRNAQLIWASKRANDLLLTTRFDALEAERIQKEYGEDLPHGGELRSFMRRSRAKRTVHQWRIGIGSFAVVGIVAGCAIWVYRAELNSIKLEYNNKEKYSKLQIQKELDAAKLSETSKNLQIEELKTSNYLKVIETERLKNEAARKDQESLEKLAAYNEAYKLDHSPEGLANPAKARQAYRKAMTLGYIPAKINFAASVLNDPIATSVEQHEAITLLKDAALKNEGIAQTALARAYEDGVGVSTDVKKALELYKMASSKGISFADYRLGNMHYTGSSGAKDYSRAMSYFKIAARSGNAQAEFGIGTLYGAGGYGVERSPSKSYIWYELSVIDGEPAARKYRDGTKNLLTSLQIDQANAIVLTCMESRDVNCE